MDLTGVARAIDHAVYTLLNAMAIVLWRLDAALIGVSLFGYQTQDWLTGRNGEGVWFLLDWLVGPTGFIGLPLWSVFLALALTLYGMARIVRPFFQFRLVDISRLFFFAAVAHIFITQGADMMRDAEDWRGEAGGFVFEAMAGSNATLSIPGAVSSGEPIAAPQDLDGETPIRGWEAVSSAYFLVESADELHRSVPPAEFRKVYCLYDPALPFDEQDDRNAEGCSPKLAWDEWDQMQITLPITSVWGINIPSISLDMPIVQEHPENRQLGQRQAMSGVGRLALGPIVALYPLVEANIGLMLTLAASFIYLSLPLMVLFSFFLPTEPLFTRLLLQYINIIIRTLILQGLAALFLMLMVTVSVNGSLTVYLGLIGVGLIGGFFLTRMAAATMRETMSQSFGAMNTLFTGAAVGTMGEAARRPAQQTMGAAKWAAGGAMLGATVAGAGWGNALDMAEPAFASADEGQRDLNGKPLPAALRDLAPDATEWSRSSFPERLRDSAGAEAGANGAGRVATENALDERGSASPKTKQRLRQTASAGANVLPGTQLGAGSSSTKNAGARPGSALSGSAFVAGTALSGATSPQNKNNNDNNGADTDKTDGDNVQPRRRAMPTGAQAPQGRVAPDGNLPAGNVSRRFRRLSEEAGLSRAQQAQLVSEAGAGEVSPELRRQIEKQMPEADAEKLIRSAGTISQSETTEAGQIRFGYHDAAEREGSGPAMRDELRREARQSRQLNTEPEVERPAPAKTETELPGIAPGQVNVSLTAGVPSDEVTTPTSLGRELEREARQSRQLNTEPEVERPAPAKTETELSGVTPGQVDVSPMAGVSPDEAAEPTSLGRELEREARQSRRVNTEPEVERPTPAKPETAAQQERAMPTTTRPNIGKALRDDAPEIGGRAEAGTPSVAGAPVRPEAERAAGLGDALKSPPPAKEKPDIGGQDEGAADFVTPVVDNTPAQTGESESEKRTDAPTEPARVARQAEIGEANPTTDDAANDAPASSTGRIGFSVDFAPSKSTGPKEKTAYQRELGKKTPDREKAEKSTGEVKGEAERDEQE